MSISGSLARELTVHTPSLRRRATTVRPIQGLRLGWAGVLLSAKLLVPLAAVVVAVLLFRLTLVDGWTFVGDSDRLNTVLNVRLLETNAVRERGAVPTWTDQQFMGSSLAGLHWMLPGFTPLPYLLALLPLSALYQALAAVSALMLVLTIAAGYVALRPYAASPLAAAVGGLAYGLSAYVVLRIAQLDLSLSLLVVMPLMLVVVRQTRRATAASSFAWLAAGWATLLLLTFLQEVAYVGMLLGAYALYRSARLRDPWPLLIFGLAFAVGVVDGLPRVLTVGQDFRELQRSSTVLETSAIEALRFFGDGLLGRTFGEGARLLGGSINLHEGIQLLGSALAALAALAVGLLSRSRLMRTLAVALILVLSVALGEYARGFYEVGIGRVAYPSRELRTILINADIFGLPLWLFVRWLAARRSAWAERDPSSAQTDGTTEGVRDAPFFLGFVLATLSIILIPEARLALYYAFFQIDFTHARLCVAALIPVAALTTMLLDRFLPARHSPRGVAWLGAGLAIGVLLWLTRERVAAMVVAQESPVVQIRPWRLLTVEVVRAATSLLVFGGALAVLAVRRWLPSLPTAAGGLLVAMIVLETVSAADFKLSGPQTRGQTDPFEAFNQMNAAPGLLRPPTPEERAAVRDRLEADQYRTVLYQDRNHFPALVEPHLAAFWDLRLVEGYSTGLPRRIATLPWARSMFDPHDLDIYNTHALKDMPWRLLAALNVKYLVMVDRSLWYNPAPGGPIPPVDPQALRIIENPLPVTPRVFFAASVTPAGDAPLFPGDDGVRPAPKDLAIEDPAQHSVVEGMTREAVFSTAGTIAPTFDGDRVTIQVDPSTETRFLVLNELYHPSWQAWIDGQPATIYPTNVVMRGIVVPPGATTVELRFVPFLVTWPGLGLMAGGLLLAALGWLGLRRWVVGSRAVPVAVQPAWPLPAERRRRSLAGTT